MVQLLIDIASMSNPCHINGSGVVVNLVHNTIIPNANAPFLVAAPQFLQPGGRGVNASRSRRGTMRTTTDAGSPYSSRAALVVNATRYLGTGELAVFDEFGFYLV
jgi:hypothetical protein